MKKTLIIVLSVLMLVFCASCSDGKTASNAEKSDALLDYITVYSPSGELEGYIEYEYDENGRQTSYGMQDTNHAWIWFYVNEYDENGNKTQMNHFDAEGNVLVTFSYENNEDGQPIKETIKYAAENLMEQYSNIEYDGENLSKVTHQDGSYYTYEYDKNGNMLNEFYYSADGELIRTYESSYDKKGNLVKTTFINGDGSRESYSTYEYNSKGETTVSFDYGEDGSLINKMEYHYIKN